MLSLPAQGQTLTENLASLVTGGTPCIALRYRMEDVELNNALRDGTASTLRTRLTFQSSVDNRFSVLLEADNTLTLAHDEQDSFTLVKYLCTALGQPPPKTLPTAEGLGSTIQREN